MVYYNVLPVKIDVLGFGRLVSQMSLKARWWLLVVLAAAIAGCGGEGTAPISKVDLSTSLNVVICTEGDSRDTVVYFKNLNDFEWQGVSFSVTKGGQEYTLGDEAQSMQGGRVKPVNWAPETVKAAEPFVEASDFTYRPSGEERGSSHKAPLKRLTHFGFLESASVKTEGPYKLQLSKEVRQCS